MRRALALLLLGLVGYGLFLLAYMPMPLALQWFAKPSPDLGLFGVRGNLTGGQADAVIADQWRFDRLRWSFSPARLLHGQLAYRLRFDGPDGRGAGLVGRALLGGGRLNDLDLVLEVPYLNRHWSLPPRFGGELQLRLQRAAIDDGRITAADGDLRWRGAHLLTEPPLPLGSFDATIAPDPDDGGGFGGPLRGSDGPLAVQGRFDLLPDGRWTLSGKLALRDRRNPALARLFGSLGRPGADGKVGFEFGADLQPLLTPGTGSDKGRTEQSGN